MTTLTDPRRCIALVFPQPSFATSCIPFIAIVNDLAEIRHENWIEIHHENWIIQTKPF